MGHILARGGAGAVWAPRTAKSTIGVSVAGSNGSMEAQLAGSRVPGRLAASASVPGSNRVIYNIFIFMKSPSTREGAELAGGAAGVRDDWQFGGGSVATSTVEVEPAGAQSATDASGELAFTLSQRGLVWFLSIIAALIVTAHIIVTLVRQYSERPIVGIDNYYTLFGLWAESSLANWFSSTLFLIAACLLALITIAKRAQSDRYTWHWAGLGVVFFALAVDDAADAHGQLSSVLHGHFQTTGLLLYAWIIPAVFMLVIFGLVFARFVWNLPADIRWRFVLAGVLFVISAVVFEAFEGRYDELHGTETMPYKIMVTIEETIEMAAIIFFIATLYGILHSMAPAVRVRLARGR